MGFIPELTQESFDLMLARVFYPENRPQRFIFLKEYAPEGPANKR
jgi:hypothetical protein